MIQILIEDGHIKAYNKNNFDLLKSFKDIAILTKFFNNWKLFIAAITRNNIRSVEKMLHTSQGRTQLCKELGNKPKKLHKAYRGAFQKLYLDGVKDLILKYCYSGALKKLNWIKAYRVINRKEEIRQAIADGLGKFVPLILNGWGIHTIKERCTKKEWKMLYHMSERRLKYLVSPHRRLNVLYMPTTLLKRGYGFINSNILYPQEFVQMLRNNFILKHLQDSVYNRLYRDWVDYFYMHRQVYGDLKPKIPKTPEQVRLWHDRLVAKINEKKYSKEQITFDIGTFEHEGWTVRPLLSKYDLHMEGKKMHHCIASYGDRIERKEYYAVSIEKGDERYTAGFRLLENFIDVIAYPTGKLPYAVKNIDFAVRKDQINGYCNKCVEINDKAVMDDIQDIIISKIEEYNKKKNEVKYDAIIDELDNLSPERVGEVYQSMFNPQGV